MVLYRLQLHVQKGGVDSVEVWLEGERGVAHQLLATNSTLRENLSNKTLTEFPLLHVLTKGAGPPAVRRPATNAPLQSGKMKSLSEGCASIGKCAAKGSTLRSTALDIVSEEVVLGPPDNDIGIVSGPPDYSGDVMPGPLDHGCGVNVNIVPGPPDSEWSDAEHDKHKQNLKVGMCASLKLIASMYSDSDED